MNKFSGWLRQPSASNREETSSSPQNNASPLQGRSPTQLFIRQKENLTAKLTPLKRSIKGTFQHISTRISGPLKSSAPATLPKADLNFVKRHSPLLDQQLASLDQTMREASQGKPISASLSEKALAISKDPYDYLFKLAHLVGQKSDNQPISFKSRDEYIDSILRHQAKGLQNEFEIRYDILTRTNHNDPGKEFAARFHSPEIKELYDQYHCNYSNPAELLTHNLAKKIAQLKRSSDTTYAEWHGQKYDNFGISPEFVAANPDIIHYVEIYFHATRRFLSPQELKLYTFDSDQHFKWLRTETADVIANQQKDKLKSIGIDPVSEFCKVISAALKHGKKENILGRDNRWSQYSFNYKGVVLKLYVKCAQESGEILQIEIPERSLNNTIHPALSKAITDKDDTGLQTIAADIDMRPEALLTEIIQPQHYLRKSLTQKDTYIYRKIFGDIPIALSAKIEDQKIVDVAGVNALDHLLRHFPEIEKTYARLEADGWNIKLQPGSGSSCDLYKKEICIADDDWRQYSINSPEIILIALVHEMAHAEYETKPIFSQEEYSSEYALNEGNSLFSEYMLLEQAADEDIKNSIMDALSIDQDYKFNQQYQIYEKWRNDKTNKLDQADQIAKEAFGNLFAQYQPSGFPTGLTYEKLWQVGYETSQSDGSQNPSNLLAELLQKDLPPKIWNKTARAWQPVSSQNVSIIARLPKQTAEDKGKIIFFDKHEFLPTPQEDGVDPSRASFELIKTGLYYGNITLESDGRVGNTMAHLQFNQHGIDYHIQLNFDEAGYVYDWTVNESEPFEFTLND
ncbi:hypothetical protein [Mycoavidus sp. B2-EB]|uniref:hypothetical protein n=1 Tax=Mycoavidus sp. B2-EB TaxID=2651972 RepID=UPI001623442A|nr:hypothetical protein [Mycoavidus sp. B2-EB]BBO60320.1 hypothetical protein MPB2EB_1460 [Mycoavidus sp. B2-EB]